MPDDPVRPATLRQCAILAGGLGTRLGALTASTPKPVLPVAGRPFLAWLFVELVRFGIEEILLLTGHLSDRVRDAVEAIAATLPRPVRIVFSHEPAPAGTGGALFNARDRLDERFLLCNGDSLFAANLADLLADACRDAASTVGRVFLRSIGDAGRYGVVTMRDDVITGFAERGVVGAAGLINAGIYVLDRRSLDEVTPHCSLERDVLPVLASRGALRGTIGEGYFIDIGIPADFARAQTELPQHLNRPALFLDRDGVINHDHGYVGTRERFAFIPGALAAIRAATSRGWHVFVVTNQSGVARGHYDEAAVQSLLAWLAEQARAAGGTIDDARYCPYHPDAMVDAYRQAHPWRKPAPGMILDLMARWSLDPARCLMVGDQATDVAAAEAAGIAGVLFPGGALDVFLEPLLERK